MSIKITDHALVRFLERVHKIDVKKLRAAVLTKHQQKMGEMGDCEITIKSNGLKYVIKDKTLITIVDTKEHK